MNDIKQNKWPKNISFALKVRTSIVSTQVANLLAQFAALPVVSKLQLQCYYPESMDHVQPTIDLFNSIQRDGVAHKLDL